MNHPTPYPDVNYLLEALLKSAQAVLGSHFTGMYLEGSLAGEFIRYVLDRAEANR